MSVARDSMKMDGTPEPVLGFEERSDEAPSTEVGALSPRPNSEVLAKPKRRASSRRSIGCGSSRRRSVARSLVRWAGCFAARGCTALI